MSEESIVLELMRALDFAILRRTASGCYQLIGNPPAFYDSLFPPGPGGPNITPWNLSHMLEFFFEESEAFFESGEAGSIQSGIWEEEGLTEKNTALKAVAVKMDNADLVIIRLLRDEYTERVGVLRKARVQIHENRELNNNLSIFKEKSRIDGLTCIFNKSTFLELLHDEMKRSKIMEYPLVIMVLDIDDFKKVNDTYGHLTGDKILQGVGIALKDSLRRNDIVARFGGEEFVILISQTSLAGTMPIAEKIRATLAAMIVPDAPPITVSIGCTEYRPGEPSDTFFQRADDALYCAKREGKNRVRTK